MTDPAAVNLGPNLNPKDPWAARPAKEPAAVTALVLSLISFVVWVVPAVVALALASAAKRNIAASEGRRSGTGLVRAARIVSALTLTLTTLGVIALAFS